MHLQPFYEHYEFFSDNSDAIAVSEDVFGRGVCLPSDTKMTEKDMARVCGIIKDCSECTGNTSKGCWISYFQPYRWEFYLRCFW